MGVAVDRFGNSYLTGLTFEGLPGAPDRHEGVFDISLAKYDRAGRLQWVRTLGSPEDGVSTEGDGLQDVGLDVAVDDVGGVYLTGITDGGLPGSVDVGPGAFIAKYSSAGQRLWVRTLGPQTGPGDGYPRPAAGSGIAVDPDGNVIVTGITYITLPGVSEPPSGNVDLFITKYSTSGERFWIHQLAMPDTDFGVEGWDEWTDVAVDRSGTAYVTGAMLRARPGRPASDRRAFDVVVASYDASGGRRWVRELASTGDEAGHGIAVDGAGGVFVTGGTTGTLPGAQSSNAGAREMFIAKYRTTGEPQWVRQYGDPYRYISNGIAIDRSRDLYLVGSGHGGAAVAKFDRAGTPLWDRYLGPTASGKAIALDPSGNPIITGASGEEEPLQGAPEPPGGYADTFIAKLNAHAPTTP
jgi:hypothetical protein